MENKKRSVEKIEALFTKAFKYHQEGLLEDAKNIYKEILEIDEDDFKSNHFLGLICYQTLDYKSAIPYLKKALTTNPEDPAALNNTGLVLLALEDYEGALAVFEKANQIRPNVSEILNNIGLSLLNLKKQKKSIEYFLKSIECNEGFVKSYIGYGKALFQLKKYDEALKAFNQAFNLEPTNIDCLESLASYFARESNIDFALDFYKKALAINPLSEETEYSIGLLNLLTKNYCLDAWLKYEKLFSKQNEGYHLIAPEWDGKPFTGKLYIWGDQGIGDQILYASMLNEAYQMHQDILCSIDQRLIPLFERSFKGIQFIPLEQEIGLEHIKADIETKSLIQQQVGLGRLGKLFRVDISDFKNHTQKYIASDQDKTKAFRQRLLVHKKKICGISWKSKNEKIGSYKTINLVDFLPALELKDYVFVDLQYGDNEKEKNALAKEHNIDIVTMDDIDNFNDIDDLYALVDACDVIMTTSNVTAHIAGSLGKETFLLLPYFYGVLWYWHKEDTQSLWYPSIEIFRQPTEDNWKDPIQKIVKKLKEKKRWRGEK
jgi:tetratricopeptide (TPR) repeat protein